jgi:predicted nucleotide-binding protein (sugar kinase/HSP70/actin superfamily)
MNNNKERIISFPHMGNYHMPISKLVENTLDGKVMIAPPITKKTIDLGSKHSPEFVCVPFKYNLGNYIEALDNGANLLIQAGGGCRFGYYGEVQEQILKDLGYDFNFFKIVDTNNVTPKTFYKKFKVVNSNLNFNQFYSAFRLAYSQVNAIDNIEKYIRENIGFEINNGSFENLEKRFHNDLKKTNNPKEVKKVYKKYINDFKQLPIDKPKNPLKVGIVGELYVLMEPFSNYFIEKELAKKGIEVRRYITISYLLFSKDHSEKQIIKEASPYLKYAIGADGTDSVAKSKQLAEEGFDGIIHVKPFGCTPEVNSMPPVQKISKDYSIPILYFSFDSQTSETGVKTRLEAFHDMLMMRKEKI